MSLISELKGVGNKIRSLAQKTPQTVSNVGNKLEDYIGKTEQARQNFVAPVRQAASNFMDNYKAGLPNTYAAKSMQRQQQTLQNRPKPNYDIKPLAKKAFNLITAGSPLRPENNPTPQESAASMRVSYQGSKNPQDVALNKSAQEKTFNIVAGISNPLEKLSFLGYGQKLTKAGEIAMGSSKDYLRELALTKTPQTAKKIAQEFMQEKYPVGDNATWLNQKLAEAKTPQKVADLLRPYYDKTPLKVSYNGEPAGTVARPQPQPPMIKDYQKGDRPLNPPDKRGFIKPNAPLNETPLSNEAKGVIPTNTEVAKELGMTPTTPPAPTPVDNLVDNVKQIPEMVKKYPGAIRRTWDKISGQAPYLRDTSEQGRQFVREILSTRANMDMTQNNAAQVFKSWLNKYKPGKDWIQQVESGVDTPMARDWKQLTDSIYNESVKAGFDPKYVENYVTRMYDWKKEDQIVRDIASNRGISIGEARQVLSKTKGAIDNFEHTLTNPGSNIGNFVNKVKNASLEFSRTEIPPELEKYRVTDPKAVIMHMIDTVGDISRAKNLGVANDKLMGLVGNLPDKTSINYAMDMLKQLGRVQEKSTGADKVANMAKRFETISKLQWGTALQNLTQSTYTAGYAGVPRTTKNILTSLPQLLTGGAKKASELGVSEANRVIPVDKAQSVYNALFKAGGFPTTETFNKIVSAKSGSEIVTGKFNKALKLLHSGNTKGFNKLRTELEDVFLVDVQKAVQEGKLSPEEIKKAGWGLTHKTQFLHPEFEMPSALTAKGWKGLTGQFKTYIWSQPKLITQSVKEAATGSPRKLMNQMVMAMMVGYPLAKASDALFKREDSKTPLTVLKYGMGGTGLGILESLWTSAKYGQATGAIAGPVISDFGTLLNNIRLAYDGKPKQLEKQLMSDLPIIGYYLKRSATNTTGGSTQGSTKGSTQKSTTTPQMQKLQGSIDQLNR